jgi:putative ABC transport system ATP-binding protein
LLNKPPTLVGTRLTRAFGNGEARTVAVDDVSMEFNRGEFSLIMGPSGCGKSTLLATLSGLLRPDAGRVEALGKDLWRMSEGERRRFRLEHFGFIFQNCNLFPTLTAREQMEMVLRWGEGASPNEAGRRVDAMLARLELERKADLLPHELSGGEKQRVAIGRALLKRPAFCFADEPTSALDWAHGEQVVALLHRAARQSGVTVLVVAHDPRIVPYADQIVHLEDGRQTGPPPLDHTRMKML